MEQYLAPHSKCDRLTGAHMVTDVGSAHSVDVGASFGAGVGASDATHVESGSGIDVATMTTTMTLTARDDVDGDDNLNCRVTCLTSEDNNSAVIPITRNK